MMYSRFDFIDAARSTGRDFVDLFSAARDPDARLTGSPSWSVTDCFGHVASTPARFMGLVDGSEECCRLPQDLVDLNAKQIANLPTRDRTLLADMLLDDLDILLDTVAHFGARVPQMDFDGDCHIRADAALGLLIGEFAVHGHDIARVTGQSWTIDPQLAPLVAHGRHQILPRWVDPVTSAGHTATYDIRLRGSDRFTFQFTDGALEINPADPRPADVHLSVEPVTAMLAAYGRVSSSWACFTGRAFAWGPRPWLATGLMKRFVPA